PTRRASDLKTRGEVRRVVADRSLHVEASLGLIAQISERDARAGTDGELPTALLRGRDRSERKRPDQRCEQHERSSKHLFHSLFNRVTYETGRTARRRARECLQSAELDTNMHVRRVTASRCKQKVKDKRLPSFFVSIRGGRAATIRPWTPCRSPAEGGLPPAGPGSFVSWAAA